MVSFQQLSAVSLYVLVVNAVLTLIGFISFLTSIVTAGLSYGLADGGWYAGLTALLCSIRGYRLLLDTSAPAVVKIYRDVILCAVVSLSIAIGSSVAMSNAFAFYFRLKACAAAAGLQTYGNSHYYNGAIQCENTSPESSCSCVSRGADANGIYYCYWFTKVDDCNRLVTTVPRSIQACYAFSVILALASAALLVVAVVAAFKPALIDDGRRTAMEPVDVVEAHVEVVNPVMLAHVKAAEVPLATPVG